MKALKKYLIKDLSKGTVTITKEQLLEIPQNEGNNINNSYSTTETLTGGTWIDDKLIYTITQPTIDTPPTMETAFPTEVIGTYTVYKYTKP